MIIVRIGCLPVFFHSPASTPNAVLAITIAAKNRGQPMEVPKSPNLTVDTLYRMMLPNHSKPMLAPANQ